MDRARWFAKNIRLIAVPNTLLKITAIQDQLKWLSLKKQGAPIAWATVLKKVGMDNYGEVKGNTEREKYINEVKRIASMRKHPFGQFTQKLGLPERPGYKRHWFSDTPGRIEDAESNGWVKVKNKAGQSVKRNVGTQRNGGPLVGYAMEIPKVFWDQDMARRHAVAQARMDQIRKNPISAPSGVARRSDTDKFYSPKAEALSIRQVDAIEKRPERT